MAFKLARHFAQQTSEPQQRARAPQAMFGARHFSSIGQSDLERGAFRFSDLPGFGSAPMPSTANESTRPATEQLKVQQETFALMSGAGINVVVKNLDQQSRFG